MMRKFLLYIVILCTAAQFSCSDDFANPDESGRFIKFLGGASDETAYKVLKTPDGGYLVLGNTVSFGNGGKDVFVIKTDKNGNREWQKNYGGRFDDEGFDIKMSKSQTVYILGYSTVEQGNQDFMLLEISMAGDSIRSVPFGRPNINERGIYLIESNQEEGGFLLVGETTGSVEENMLVVKIDDSGSLQWEKEYGLTDSFDEIASVIEAPDGDLIVGGSIGRSSNSNEKDIRVVKLNLLGSILWEYNYGSGNGANERASQIIYGGTGYFVVGTTAATTGGSDIVVLHIDKQGKPQGDAMQFDYGGSEVSASIVKSDVGGYAICGTIVRGEKDSDILVIKTNFDGVEEWSSVFGGEGLEDVGNYVVNGENGGYAVLGTLTYKNNKVIGLVSTDRRGIALAK